MRQIGMDRLQVRQIVAIRDGVFAERTHAGTDEVGLGVFPVVVVGDAERVDQNIAARIGVPIRHRDAAWFRRCERPGVRACGR